MQQCRKCALKCPEVNLRPLLYSDAKQGGPSSGVVGRAGTKQCPTEVGSGNLL